MKATLFEHWGHLDDASAWNRYQKFRLVDSEGMQIEKQGFIKIGLQGVGYHTFFTCIGQALIQTCPTTQQVLSVTNLSWKKLEPFMETRPGKEATYGFSILSGQKFIDLHLRSQVELDEWLSILQPKMINQGFEEDYVQSNACVTHDSS